MVRKREKFDAHDLFGWDPFTSLRPFDPRDPKRKIVVPHRAKWYSNRRKKSSSFNKDFLDELEALVQRMSAILKKKR